MCGCLEMAGMTARFTAKRFTKTFVMSPRSDGLPCCLLIDCSVGFFTHLSSALDKVTMQRLVCVCVRVCMQSGQPRRKSSLSAATQKSLERKKERMWAIEHAHFNLIFNFINLTREAWWARLPFLRKVCFPPPRLQKKAAGRHRGAVARSDRGAGSSAQQQQQTKGGRLKADPQRVPKSTYSSRPRWHSL